MAEQLVSFFLVEESKSSHCYLLWEIAYLSEECVGFFSAEKYQTSHDSLTALKEH